MKMPAGDGGKSLNEKLSWDEDKSFDGAGRQNARLIDSLSLADSPAAMEQTATRSLRQRSWGLEAGDLLTAGLVANKPMSGPVGGDYYWSMGDVAYKRLPYGYSGAYGRAYYDGNGQWLGQLFPPVPAPSQKPKEPKKPWPEAARQLARSLLRNDQILGFKDGLRIDRRSESFDARWGQLTTRSRTMTFVSPTRWLTRSEGDGTQTIVSWCDGRVRGVFGTAFQLGRQRAAKPEDLAIPPVQLSGGYSLVPLDYASRALCRN